MRSTLSRIVALVTSMIFMSEGGLADAAGFSFLDHDMQFVIVRSNSALCEPSCPEWIYAEGQIVAETPSAFQKVLKSAGKAKLPLVIVSPGGNVDAAMQMGRIIRKRGMDVEVGFTQFSGCRPFEKGCRGYGPAEGVYYGAVQVGGAFCWSACPLVLAGGRKRYSSDWSYTGVHQVTTIYQKEKIFYRERYRMVNGKKQILSRKVIGRQDAGQKVTTDLPKKTRRTLVRYLGEMGIETSLIDAMLSTAPDRIRLLKPDELVSMRLVSRRTEGDVLTAPESCAGGSRRQNCIRREGDTLTGLPQAQADQ